MTTNSDMAVPMSTVASCQPRSGSPSCGSPRGTWPSTATPCPARSASRLTMIAAITAISSPGILRVTQRLAPRAASTITMTPADTLRSAACACGIVRAMSRNLTGALVPVTVTPSMSGICLAATWMPTPVRNPSSTVRDRKLARNPSRASRASSSSPPASRAASPASRTYCGEPTTASPARAALNMAAVAESAPTTRWRDEPRRANTAIGNSSVYRPVTTGIPAIFAYPRATGMLTAARVMPAITSAVMRDRCTGSSPFITGSARNCARRERLHGSGTFASAAALARPGRLHVVPPPRARGTLSGRRRSQLWSRCLTGRPGRRSLVCLSTIMRLPGVHFQHGIASAQQHDAGGRPSSPAGKSARGRGAVRRERRGGYQPGLVGQHHGLDAVAQAQFGENPANVDLHGALGKVQAGRDLAVGHACGDAGQDVLLAAGEGVAYLGGAVPAERLGLLGAAGGGELPDQALGGARREYGVAGGDGPDGGDQVVRLGVLEQEPAGPRAQSGVDIVVEVKGGQDQHLRRQPGRHDVAGRLDAVPAGHPDIHQHHVGPQRGGHGDRGY